MSDSGKPINEQEVIAKYKALEGECQSSINKISEMEQELGEHRYVWNLPNDILILPFRY